MEELKYVITMDAVNELGYTFGTLQSLSMQFEILREYADSDSPAWPSMMDVACTLMEKTVEELDGQLNALTANRMGGENE